MTNNNRPGPALPHSSAPGVFVTRQTRIAFDLWLYQQQHLNANRATNDTEYRQQRGQSKREYSTMSPLTAKEHRAMLAEAEREIRARLGKPPTLGDASTTKTARAADAIRNGGRIVTLLAAELMQAAAALLLLLFFALVELERLLTGARALGQNEAAVLIAIGFTVGNVLMPIYKLRAARVEGLHQQRYTLKGRVLALWDKVAGDEHTEALEPTHNPALVIADRLILGGTLFLASFAVLGPSLADTTGAWYTELGALLGSSFNDFALLSGGIALSMGGVLALRAISHEVGVRTLTDAPPSAEAQHNAAAVEYERRAESIRAEVRARYARQDLAARPTMRPATGDQVAPMLEHPTASTNGNGHNGNGMH